MTTAERVRLHRRQVADRYGLTVAALNRRLSPDRAGFPPPDGYDRDGSWWWEDNLPAELPARPKGPRPRS